jgi:hypothetical protein
MSIAKSSFSNTAVSLSEGNKFNYRPGAAAGDLVAACLKRRL